MVLIRDKPCWITKPFKGLSGISWPDKHVLLGGGTPDPPAGAPAPPKTALLESFGRPKHPSSAIGRDNQRISPGISKDNHSGAR